MKTKLLKDGRAVTREGNKTTMFSKPENSGRSIVYIRSHPTVSAAKAEMASLK